MRRNRGFTLIELLVVISIIVLLIAILLPTLQAIRRTTKVVLCLSNLKAYSTGLTAWAVDDSSGHYPPHYSWAADLVWSAGHGVNSMAFHMLDDPRYSSKYEFLDEYLERVAGESAGDVLWCPLDRDKRPGEDSLTYFDTNLWTDPRYGRAFWNGFGTETYWVGYVRFAAWKSTIADWRNSGNVDPTGPVMSPAGAQDVVLADIVMAECCHNGINNHADIPRDYRTHRENNVTYSDGHAETHAHKFIESGPPAHWSDHYLLQGISAPGPGGTMWLY